MRTTLRALAVITVAAAVSALAACGGAGSGTAAPETPASEAADTTSTQAGAGGTGTTGRGGDEAAVETLFHDYYRALLARDFAGACAFNSPETTAELLAGLRARGVTATSCEEGFRKLYAVPGAAAAADAVANSATVQNVTVNGDQATIAWSADINGGRPTVTSGLRRVDGRWLLVDMGR